jgi:hypothetical protein
MSINILNFIMFSIFSKESKFPNAKNQILETKSPSDTPHIVGESLVDAERRAITEINGVGVGATVLGSRPIVGGYEIIPETGFIVTYTSQFCGVWQITSWAKTVAITHGSCPSGDSRPIS